MTYTLKNKQDGEIVSGKNVAELVKNLEATHKHNFIDQQYRRWSNSGKAKAWIGTGRFDPVDVPQWLVAAYPSEYELEVQAELDAVDEEEEQKYQDYQTAFWAIMNKYAAMWGVVNTKVRYLWNNAEFVEFSPFINTPERKAQFEQMMKEVNEI